MSKIIIQEQKNRVIELYKEGTLQNLEIMKLCDISLKTLYKILDENGIDKKNHPLEVEVVRIAVEMYKKDYKLSEIYEKTGISCATLYKELDERKIPRRIMCSDRKTEKKDKLESEDSDNIIELYLLGKTKTQISIELVVAYKTVKDTIEQAIKKGIICQNPKETEKQNNTQKVIAIAKLINELKDDDIVVRDVARAFKVSERCLYYHVQKQKESL